MLIIEDIDLNIATTQEIKNLIKLCAKHTAITIRNQIYL